MGEFYNKWMLNDPRYLEMMKRRAALGVPDYQLNTPSLSPSNMQGLDASSAGILDSTTPMPGGSNWMDYAGLGMMGAAPVAAALLGKDTSKKYAPYAPASSVGGKPMIRPENPYPQTQRMPAFLARLLMGVR